MPIYEYICEDCQEHFEKIVINKQQEISCPKCSSKKATIQLSVFATAGNGSASSSPSVGFSGAGGGCCGVGSGCHLLNSAPPPDAHFSFIFNSIAYASRSHA